MNIWLEVQQETSLTKGNKGREGTKEMVYLMMHSTHFFNGYMEMNIWLRETILTKGNEGNSITSTHFIYSYIYGYTSRGALAVYLMMHLTHFIYGYMAMLTYGEKRAAATTWVILFDYQQGIFLCM